MNQELVNAITQAVMKQLVQRNIVNTDSPGVIEQVVKQVVQQPVNTVQQPVNAV